mmetsp:Transcript_36916/g.119445  ORF Transcript_36916/g.119445 Transcript_36916/m.119445 type:complete len:321 (-) Transcript_36916:272-1234(-)
MFAAGLADSGGVPVSAAQRAQRAQVERASTAIEERLDELAVKVAVLSQLSRHSEAVLFLREGKALYLEQQRRFPDGFCTACVHLRPPRTHHCRITDRCVARYDHYCCYIGNSVGHGNYRWFFGFVWAAALHAALLLTASASLLLLLTASLLADHDPHHGPARPHAHSHEAAAAYYGDASPPPPPPLPRPSASVFGRAALEAARTCPVALLLCLYCAAVSALLVGFGSFHALLISRNLTTYEHIKQVYKGEDGVVRNPFDRGLLGNWAEALIPDATLRRVYSTPLPDRQSPHPLPAACSPSNARPATLPQTAPSGRSAGRP